MSLSSSLNIAVAGLDVSSKRAQVVAQNVANADRVGYAMRSLETSGGSIGGSGMSTSVQRETDGRLVQLRREAQSRQEGDATLATFMTRVDSAIGDPDKAGSLQDALSRLDVAFASSAAAPNSAVRLTEVLQAAKDLSSRVQEIDRTIGDARQNADSDIDRSVKELNTDLAGVERLNKSIRRLRIGGSDAANLIDQRAAAIDRISAKIPLRELPREDGTLALVSNGGLLLLDDKAAVLEFAGRSPITAAMTFPVNLSGLSVNGRDVAMSGASSGIPGGGLAALFELRDEVTVEASKRLDGFAADIIARFEDPAVDTTRTAGSPGLFTNDGGVLTASPAAGLAKRFELNALVDPDLGGASWRIRDGLGAIGPSSSPDPGLLLEYGAAMAKQIPQSLPGLSASAANAIERAGNLKSMFAFDRLRYEDRVASNSSEVQTLLDRRDGGGVDVDAEMRRLIEIEQAYAANARVIQAVGDMINRITEI